MFRDLFYYKSWPLLMTSASCSLHTSCLWHTPCTKLAVFKILKCIQQNEKLFQYRLKCLFSFKYPYIYIGFGFWLDCDFLEKEILNKSLREGSKECGSHFEFLSDLCPIYIYIWDMLMCALKAHVEHLYMEIIRFQHALN